MDYYGYIYLTIFPQGSIDGIPDTPDLRPFYIGQRKGKVKDTYFGSGAVIRDWLKSKGVKGYTCVNSQKAYLFGLEHYILCYAHSEQELNSLEEFFVNPVLKTSGCLNKKGGGRLGKIIEEVWTPERRDQQSKILSEYNETLKQDQEYAAILNRRRNSGILLAEWVKQDKLNNPEKYRKLYESVDLRKKYSDSQITAHERFDVRENHIAGWNDDNRKQASEREAQKWTEDARKKRSSQYKGCRHWTDGVNDVYQRASPGTGWVPARLGTKKSCELLGIPFTLDLVGAARIYFTQKRRNKLRKHNKGI